MIEVAEDLFLLAGVPRYAINVYLMQDVLLDAGTRWRWSQLERQLAGRKVAAHALTHGHPDHQGSSRKICDTLGVPLWCGDADADAVETGEWIRLLPWNPITAWGGRAWAGPACQVARRLRDGDEVGGFRVVESPGHSPGHVSYWRERDRLLITGDVLANWNPWKGGIFELRTPPSIFTCDPARNRASARKLAALEPRRVCFSHGPPLDDMQRFQRFVARL